MQRRTAFSRTAFYRLVFASFIAILTGGAAQASPAPLPETHTTRDDVINRDIMAETQLYCLALAIYFEGGSTDEPEIGQRHVARVVVARAAANRTIWGGSNICDVVFYQRKKTCQFSFACLPTAQRTPRGGPAWRYSMDIAKDELEGRSYIEDPLLHECGADACPQCLPVPKGIRSRRAGRPPRILPRSKQLRALGACEDGTCRMQTAGGGSCRSQEEKDSEGQTRTRHRKEATAEEGDGRAALINRRPALR
jgi:hypothetical protein